MCSGSPAVVGVVEIAPLNAAQEAGQLGFIEIEAGAETRRLDVVEGQYRQVVAIGLLCKLEHVELPALLCILQTCDLEVDSCSRRHCWHKHSMTWFEASSA